MNDFSAATRETDVAVNPTLRSALFQPSDNAPTSSNFAGLSVTNTTVWPH